MKTKCTLLIFLGTFQICFCQYSPPNFLFNDLSTVPCPFDNSQEILTADFWSIYQTQNDQWDGPVDSTQCIEVYEDGFNINFALNQIDLDKPIFVRSKLEEVDPRLLNNDFLYNGNFSFVVDDGIEINLNNDCENDLCSGLLVSIEIPNESGTGVSQREYRKSVSESFNNNYQASFCYATEKFDSPILKEYILKITLDPESTGEWIQLRSAFNEGFDEYSTYKITDLEIPDFYYVDTSYVYSLINLAGIFEATNFLVMYADTTYPSTQNPSYVDITPTPNVPTQEFIDIIVEDFQTLVFQPFAFLRGGLIEGSDSLRHHYNLINNGAEICMYTLIEFVFSGSNGYMHQGGNIDFHGTTSCFMFRHGGELRVAENAYLQYGDGGEGILALGERSRVNLETGSSLVIDNKVMLIDVVDNFEQEIKVDLQPGSLLAFGLNASIRRAAGEDGNQMLNVYMNGGILDDHKLSEEERSMINRIYPESSRDFYPEESIFIYPNPVQSALTYRYDSEFEEFVGVEVLNAKGQIVYKSKHAMVEGINDIVFDFRSPIQGVYILRLETAKGVRSAKFIK